MVNQTSGYKVLSQKNNAAALFTLSCKSEHMTWMIKPSEKAAMPVA